MAKSPAATALQDGSGDRNRRTPLSRERIVATAIEMMDEEGMAALSMRRLGAKLSVQAMSLYGYFPNKDSLLTAAGDLLFARIGDPDPALDPLDGIRQVMMGFYSLAEEHPCVVDLLYTTPSAPARLERGATDIAALAQVLGEDARQALGALVAFVVGAIHQLRLGGPERRGAFTFGLERMIEGMRSEAARRKSAPT